MTTRRHVISGSIVAALLPTGTILGQARDLPELEPVRALEYTEIPGAGEFPPYQGDDIGTVLWQTPADLEDMSFAVRGTIRHRWVAREGYGYRAGYEGDVYRSLIWTTLDGNRDAFLAANDDLTAVKDLRTFAATGVYGGIYEFSLGGIWEVPLILVSEIGPAKSA